ncbi:MAG: prevent-host-death protein [Verrucomicrobia bacterium]|nr:prevent-host-death protein [Verrucomicrobiota bacterium]
MKTTTVADLRNHFARISEWISEGESVQVCKHGRPFAVLAPVPARRTRVTAPNFLKRMQTEYPHQLIPRSESAALREDMRGGR